MAAPKPSDLVIGEDYLSVVCSACGDTIPLQPSRSLFGDKISGYRGEGTESIGCPFCALSAEYPVSEIKSRPLRKLPPTAQ